MTCKLVKNSIQYAAIIKAFREAEPQHDHDKFMTKISDNGIVTQQTERGDGLGMTNILIGLVTNCADNWLTAISIHNPFQHKVIYSFAVEKPDPEVTRIERLEDRVAELEKRN